MIKFLVLMFISSVIQQAFAVEKCSYELKSENIKLIFNFYEGNLKKEQKGYFSSIELKGILYGNSPRSIFNGISFYLPFKSLNTFNSKRDRMIYSALTKSQKTAAERILIKIKKLKKREVELEIDINGKILNTTFELDTQDVSLQSIGYIDNKDLNLTPIKNAVQKAFNIKVWDDVFIDLKIKFNKKCEVEL